MPNQKQKMWLMTSAWLQQGGIRETVPLPGIKPLCPSVTPKSDPLYYFLYWSIVALQYCVSLHSTANWMSYRYTYIPSFVDFLLIWVTAEHWVEFPVLYSRFSLVIYFIHSINSVHMSIPISQFIPPPHPPALVSIRLFSMSVSLFLLWSYLNATCSFTQRSQTAHEFLMSWVKNGISEGLDYPLCCWYQEGRNFISWNGRDRKIVAH